MNQMWRPLILFLCLWFCPRLVWAADDFCGHARQVSHACPMHSGQACQCHEHDLCYRIAQEKPSPKAPAPPRFEFLCPLPMEVEFRPTPVMLVEKSIPLFRRCLTPSLAPEPPPPRA
ncbi:hypothetical protein ABS71_14645 [bacterium SCN 62-11]|nr:MAG: hypothetical protein ABS71_14645 [bacterium SCN 62-11]